jgi:hypothetical protein
MTILPSAIQFFMDQVPGTVSSFINQEFDLDELHFRRLFGDVSEKLDPALQMPEYFNLNNSQMIPYHDGLGERKMFFAFS